jgi:hypothetical protein
MLVPQTAGRSQIITQLVRLIKRLFRLTDALLRPPELKMYIKNMLGNNMHQADIQVAHEMKCIFPSELAAIHV